MEEYQSSCKRCNLVGGAIIASTLQNSSVFLPIVFTQGLSRQLFTVIWD